METHLVLLEIAREDLKAASLLLEKKLYPQSVFFLQQSVEKLLKSLGIWTNIISMTEAKKDIKHLGHGIYLKFLRSTSNLEIPDATIQIMEKEGLGREYIAKLKLRADQVQIQLLKYSPRKVLNSTLFSGDALSDMLAEIQGEMQEMREFEHELQEQFERKSQNEVEAFRTLVNFLIPLRELRFCWGSLLELSLTFSPHEAATRYPESDFNPLEVYIETTPLIQILGPYIKVTEGI